MFFPFVVEDSTEVNLIFREIAATQGYSVERKMEVKIGIEAERSTFQE